LDIVCSLVFPLLVWCFLVFFLVSSRVFFVMFWYFNLIAQQL
jgi:hypothetical protein